MWLTPLFNMKCCSPTLETDYLGTKQECEFDDDIRVERNSTFNWHLVIKVITDVVL